MEDVTTNADGSKNLMAGKTLLAIVGHIIANPGINTPGLLAAMEAQGTPLKPATLDHHLDRLHLRGAIQKRPGTGQHTGRGRAPLGIHWTGAYTPVDADVAYAERKANEAKDSGPGRIRSSMTAEECVAKADALSLEAQAMWQAYNFSAVTTKSAFTDFSDKVRAKVERAAGLRFRALSILPCLAQMTFSPEPEAPASPVTEATVAPVEAAPVEAAPIEGEAPKAPKRGRKASVTASV